MEELKFRISGDAKEGVKAFQDVQLEMKQVQALANRMQAELAGAKFLGDKEAIKELRKSYEAVKVSLLDLRAENAFAKLEQDGKQSSKILKEGFETAAGEIVESFGVDGDIANEVGKMLGNLPTQAKIALAAMTVAVVGAAATVGTLVAITSKMVDVAKEIGDGSAEDFRKLQKEMKAAGVEVTTLDRALSQDLTKSFDQMKLAVDGVFVGLIRDAGPAAIVMFRTLRDEINRLSASAGGFGKIFSYALIGVTAEIKTFLQTVEHTINAVDLLMKGGQINRVRALAELAQAAAIGQRFEENLRQAAYDTATYKPGAATYETKDAKGPNRASAREQLEKELDRIRIRNAQVTTESLRDNDVLRAATDQYLNSLNATIERQKGFVAILAGQAAQYQAIAVNAIKTAKEVRDVQFATAEIELRRLSTFYGNEIVIIQARAKLERRAEIDRYEAAKAALEEQLKANQVTQADDAAIAAAKLVLQKQLNALLEEEQKRHRASIDLINRGEKVETERATPGSVRNVLGDRTADELGAAGEQLKGFAAIVAGVKAQVSADLKAMGNAGAQPLQVLGGMTAKLAVNMAQAGFAALISGRSIGQAMKQAAAAGIAAIAQLAAVEAIKNLAWGLHAAGLTFIPGYQSAGGAVPNFFAAAAAWGSLAAGAGVAAAALSRGGGSTGAGGGALGSALTGTRPDDSTRGTEDRFRFIDRDAQGRQTSNTVVTLKIEQGIMVERVEQAALTSFRQGGALKQITDNATSGIPITPS